MAKPEDLEIPRCLETADEAIAVVRALHAKWQDRTRSGAQAPAT
jgi:hypothetical protein